MHRHEPQPPGVHFWLIDCSQIIILNWQQVSPKEASLLPFGDCTPPQECWQRGSCCEGNQLKKVLLLHSDVLLFSNQRQKRYLKLVASRLFGFPKWQCYWFVFDFDRNINCKFLAFISLDQFTAGIQWIQYFTPFPSGVSSVPAS